jgi:hypothetical protein
LSTTLSMRRAIAAEQPRRGVWEDGPVIHFVDPRAQPSAPVEPYELRWDVDGDAPHVVGVLANGFPDSVPFCDEVGAALARRLPGITVRAWNKGNASAPASDELLDAIASEVSVCVAAYGH